MSCLSSGYKFASVLRYVGLVYHLFFSLFPIYFGDTFTIVLSLTKVNILDTFNQRAVVQTDMTIEFIVSTGCYPVDTMDYA